MWIYMSYLVTWVWADLIFNFLFYEILIPRQISSPAKNKKYQFSCPLHPFMYTILGRISWVTVTILKIFNICQYLSRDSMANIRKILFLRSRWVILIFVIICLAVSSGVLPRARITRPRHPFWVSLRIHLLLQAFSTHIKPETGPRFADTWCISENLWGVIENEWQPSSSSHNILRLGVGNHSNMWRVEVLSG